MWSDSSGDEQGESLPAPALRVRHDDPQGGLRVIPAEAMAPGDTDGARVPLIDVVEEWSSDDGVFGADGADGADVDLDHVVDDEADDDAPTPLPWRQLVPLMLLLLADSISLTSIFPYASFMVVEFGLADLATAGRYVGLLASSYSLAQLACSTPFGWLSDQLGRRPLLLAGGSFTMIWTILFGFSSSFPMAIAMRTLTGLCNGNVGIMKSYLGEILDSSNKPRGFSLLGATTGVGRVAGSLLGGLLSQPAVQYPTVFSRHGFWGRHPWLLPNMVAASLSLAAVVLGFFFVQETHFPPGRMATCVRRLAPPAMRRSYPRAALEGSGDDDDEDSTRVEDMNRDAGKVPFLTRHGSDACGGADSNDMGSDDDDDANDSDSGGGDFSTVKPHPIPLRKDPGVVIPILLYGAIAFIYIGFDEVFPLLAVAPKKNGGLDFRQRHVGIVQMCGGGSLLFFQLILYPIVAGRLGPRRLFTRAMFASPVLLFMFPFTTVFVLVSNSTYSSNLGRVNGVGQTSAAVARCVGPILVGIVFAATSTSGKSFPLNFHCVYLVLAVAALGTGVLSTFLPHHLDDSYDDVDGDIPLHDLSPSTTPTTSRTLPV